MRAIWSPTAISDLERAHAYIAEHDPNAAADVAPAILDAVERLREFPGLGRAGGIPNTRELVVPGTRYMLVYTVMDNHLAITDVRHFARKRPDED